MTKSRAFYDDEIIEAYGITDLTINVVYDYEVLLSMFEANIFDVFEILRLINPVINELNNL